MSISKEKQMKILYATKEYIEMGGTINSVAQKYGLNRKTVAKHVKKYLNTGDNLHKKNLNKNEEGHTWT